MNSTFVSVTQNFNEKFLNVVADVVSFVKMPNVIKYMKLEVRGINLV